jgi:uncharacterized protein
MSHGIWSLLRLILFSVLGGYVLLGTYLYFTQARLIYFPSREIGFTPADIGLSYDSFTVRASDGVEITGWFVPAPDPRGTVLFCHGNGGNIADRQDTISILHGLGLDICIFDYRGYGESDGTPSEIGTTRDTRAVHDWLVKERGIAPASIIIHGRSLGAAIAARIAVENPPRLLILESPFASIVTMGKALYPWLPVRLMTRFRYDTATYAAQIRCPVLVIHSRTDDIIPWEQGRTVFETVSEPKRFLEITGGHNDGFITSGDQYVKGLKSFIDDYLGE